MAAGSIFSMMDVPSDYGYVVLAVGALALAVHLLVSPLDVLWFRLLNRFGLRGRTG